ncbi:monothiol glutaredoxin-S15, mitochondrial-like [Coffea arabica]|uniref:Monothiol glutaredoxin-S15, mitochondrial-like n=1 Tax=Coffea arabica TaxID=13443 RepID=A0ABM4UFD1_COFAR
MCNIVHTVFAVEYDLDGNATGSLAFVLQTLQALCLNPAPFHSPNSQTLHSSWVIFLAATFFCRGVIFYSTTVPNDPDTHEDFRPTIKLESSGLSLTDIVEQDVKEKPVMIYMKGVPDLPRCGFSSLAVRVLKEYSIPISARNILENVELKNAVKAYSNWPTFPQIFIKGEFIGGSDIILNMHQVLFMIYNSSIFCCLE